MSLGMLESCNAVIARGKFQVCRSFSSNPWFSVGVCSLTVKRCVAVLQILRLRYAVHCYFYPMHPCRRVRMSCAY